MRIGLIGPGVMGKAMLLNWAKSFDVSFYARKVLDLPLKNYPTIKELVANNDVIISIVGMPSDVEEVYFQGIFNCDITGKILIDMTTSSPELARRIANLAKQKGAKALDCPVTGGDIGAKNGTLTIFCGGEKEDFDEVLPLLKSVGTTIYYAGIAGMGQSAKLANQIGIAGAISAMAEMIAFCEKTGLNTLELIPIFASGSAGSWQLKNMGPRALNGDLNPGFFIKHFVKDMNLVQEVARQSNLDLPMLKTVLHLFESLIEQGYEDLGTQALVKYYR